MLTTNIGSAESISGPFPSKESLISSWRIELHEVNDHRSTENLPTTCDIFIIGAGPVALYDSSFHAVCRAK